MHLPSPCALTMIAPAELGFVCNLLISSLVWKLWTEPSFFGCRRSAPGDRGTSLENTQLYKSLAGFQLLQRVPLLPTLQTGNCSPLLLCSTLPSSSHHFCHSVDAKHHVGPFPDTISSSRKSSKLCTICLVSLAPNIVPGSKSAVNTCLFYEQMRKWIFNVKKRQFSR